MEKNLKRVYEFQGLGCANCALKIEKEINKLSYVESAVVNPITSKAIIELKEEIESQIIYKDIEKITSRIEHGVRIKEVNGKATVKKISSKNNIKAKSTIKKQNFSEVAKDDKYKKSRKGSHHEHDHNNGEENMKAKLIKLSIGVAFLVMANFIEGNLKLLFFGLAYLIIGGEVLLIAGRNILRGQVFDENFLMTIATIGAFVIGEYPEAVGVMLFYQIGEFFQSLAVDKSKKSISTLMDIRPDYANIKKSNGDIEIIAPEKVYIDDIIVVKPGEKIPLDGVIINGQSQIDTSALTGESVPRIVKERDEVLAGSINKTGVLELRVTKEFSESTVSKILELVENASNKKAPTEKFITKFARYYTPVVVIVAIILAIIPPIIGMGEFKEWLYTALVFLVVSCPCALVISIPLSFFGGIGGASKNGILVKGGNYLEALNKAEIVVFDKTGTLSEGVFEVTKIVPYGFITEDMIMEYAAYAEIYSNHPIARSIVESYKRISPKAIIDKSRIKSYEEISGKGVKIYLGDRYIYVGNHKLMDELEIEYRKSSDVGTIVYLAINSKFIGHLVISDRIKETAPKGINDLKKVGINQTVMLTGDNSTIAEYVGKVVKIDKIYSDLLPQGKVEKIEELSKELSKNGKILFVGDGINDAPVLARADVGIAMGGIGSDAAIEASDVVIMTDDPAKIAVAIKIARKTQKIVIQNIIFALGVKAAILVLTVLHLSTMWMAVFADVGVTLIAVLNAVRAMKLKD